MTTNRALALAAGGLVAGGLALAPIPVSAAETAPRGKERCITAIERRLATLAQLTERAKASGPLTDAHEAAVTATTRQQAEGLQGLREQVRAATTATGVAEPCRRVVPEYRVYVLTRPKVHLTIAADTLGAAGTRLEGAIGTLQHAADAAEAAGRDVTAAQAEIDAARAGATKARTLAGGVPDAVLALQPAGYPANASVLTSSRSTLTEARTALRAARRDAQEARDLLST
jgi:hypothetical protein